MDSKTKTGPKKNRWTCEIFTNEHQKEGNLKPSARTILSLNDLYTDEPNPSSVAIYIHSVTEYPEFTSIVVQSESNYCLMIRYTVCDCSRDIRICKIRSIYQAEKPAQSPESDDSLRRDFEKCQRWLSIKKRLRESQRTPETAQKRKWESC